MNWLWAGLVAACAAYAANRFIYRIYSDRALIGPVPLAEEVAKTMTATLLGAGILYTHLVFGMAEAILDWRGKTRRLPAALSALAAHGIFGLTTLAVLRLTNILGAAIAVAFLTHALWNAVMLLRPVKR
jgi:hypothetical protein